VTADEEQPGEDADDAAREMRGFLDVGLVCLATSFVRAVNGFVGFVVFAFVVVVSCLEGACHEQPEDPDAEQSGGERGAMSSPAEPERRGGEGDRERGEQPLGFLVEEEADPERAERCGQ